MIIVVEKDRVYLSYSLGFAARVSDIFPTLDDMFLESNQYVWRVKGQKNCIMSGTSYMRFNDVLRYDKSLFKCRKFDYETLVSVIKPRIMEKLRDNNGIDNDKDTRNIYFIAKDNKAYIINNNDCDEIEEYWTSGCYNAFSKAGIIKYKDLPIYERIYKTMLDIDKNTNERIFPILVTDTKSSKQKVIYQDGSVKTL